jgi:hypothetical protein
VQGDQPLVLDAVAGILGAICGTQCRVLIYILAHDQARIGPPFVSRPLRLRST